MTDHPIKCTGRVGYSRCEGVAHTAVVLGKQMRGIACRPCAAALYVEASKAGYRQPTLQLLRIDSMEPPQVARLRVMVDRMRRMHRKHGVPELPRLAGAQKAPQDFKRPKARP